MYIDLLLGLFFLHVQHQNSYIPSNDERFTSKSLCARAVKKALINELCFDSYILYSRYRIFLTMYKTFRF